MQLVRSAATRGRSLVFSTSSPHPQLEYEWRSYAVGFCRPSDSGSRGRLIKSWVVGSNPTGGHRETLGNISFQGFFDSRDFWLQTQLVILTATQLASHRLQTKRPTRSKTLKQSS